MKASNIIVYAVAFALSALMLWMWCYLGFNQVDGVADIAVSVVWWAVIIGTAVAIVSFENTRREKVRTTYVGPGFVFNSEVGCELAEGASVEAVEAILKALTYNFTKVEIDPATKSSIKAVIRTRTYVASDTGEPQWEGEFVPATPGAQPVPFASKTQLAILLSSL